jgi:hypothetical protein
MAIIVGQDWVDWVEKTGGSLRRLADFSSICTYREQVIMKALLQDEAYPSLSPK